VAERHGSLDRVHHFDSCRGEPGQGRSGAEAPRTTPQPIRSLKRTRIEPKTFRHDHALPPDEDLSRPSRDSTAGRLGQSCTTTSRSRLPSSTPAMGGSIRSSTTTVAPVDWCSIILVRIGFPPAIIYRSNRPRCLRALRRADAGDPGELGELLVRAVLDDLLSAGDCITVLVGRLLLVRGLEGVDAGCTSAVGGA
jgi:hypothetical protein